MKKLNSFKELSNINLDQNEEKTITKDECVVTEDELLEYLPYIKRKANRLVRAYSNATSKEDEENCIPNLGYSSKDIQQELLIEAWQVLLKYDPEKQAREYPSVKKSTFIISCLETKAKSIHRKIMSKKRGMGIPHDNDSFILTGEMPDLEE